jgi:dTDP-4-dehydrorhamnose reductase
LADSILKLCQLKPSGIFHVTNSETTTWSNFASKILNFAGIDGVEIEEISTNQLARPAPRPLYSVLDTSKFERFTGMKMRSWDEAVREYISTRNY